MKPRCYRLGLLAALVLGLAGVAPAATAPPPNLVIILADDLGYGDVGCYNPDSKIPTPALNRLADAGMRFTDAHAPDAVCTPTRYGLLTGRYAFRSRLKSGVKARTPVALRWPMRGAASHRPSTAFSLHWPKMTKCFPGLAEEYCSSVHVPVLLNFNSTA